MSSFSEKVLKKFPNAIKTNLGAYYVMVTEGKGDSPKQGVKVKTHYTGTLLSNGNKFDSSRDRNKLFEFTLGANSGRNALEYFCKPPR